MAAGDASSLSASERLAGDLEREILQQRHPSGARLALRSELIERFGVSAGTMNEALRILRERGLITVKPGVRGGVFVAQPPPQVRLGAIDLWFREHELHPLELLEARSVLEDSLAVVAAERATPEDLRDVEWALEELRAARADARAYIEANMRFHAAVTRAARVPVLAGMYDALVASIRALLVRAEFAGPGAHATLEHSLAAHAALARAIREGDQGALSVALGEHHTGLVSLGDPSRSPVARGTEHR
ncbi:MAG: FadR/GntR family transcriptional regulator [Actinomycetales bacterium]